MSEHEEKEDDEGGCPHCDRIDNAVDAIVSVVNMFKTEPSDGITSLAISLGLILAQFVKEEGVEEVLDGICDHALYVFRKENGLEDEPSEVLQIEDSPDDNSSESTGKNPKTRH